MVRKRWKLALSVAVALAAMCGATATSAEWLVSGSLGGAFAPAFDLVGGDNDRAARCDGYVNPRYAEIPACTQPDRGVGAVDDWRSAFDGGAGAVGGVGIGYGFGEAWRAEAEWLRSAANVDQTALILSPGGTPYVESFGAELPRAEERLGTVASNGVFVNLLHMRMIGRRVHLGGGIGLGWVATEADYEVLWARSTDPSTVRTAAGLANEEEVKRNLAGTATTARTTLRDDGAAAQLLAGLDYRVRDDLAAGLWIRWVVPSAFEPPAASYDRLRSHPSNLRRDGSEPVTYRVAADALDFAAVTLKFTYMPGGQRG